MEMEHDSPRPTPMWRVLLLVIPAVAISASGLTALFTGGVEYGKLQNSLDIERDRYDKAMEQLSSYQEANRKWAEAYSSKEEALTQAQAHVSRLLNDQCQEIQNTLESISRSLANSDAFGYSESRRSSLENEYNQNHASLRACFAARK